jgi:molybdopterin converting factor small subunit
MVRVRLFAGLKDLAKRGEMELPWREGLTVGTVRAMLVERTPDIGTLLSRSKAAVGDDLAEDDAVVPDAVEVSFLPPVSGG